MAGIGTSPAGLSAFGYGTPEAAPTPSTGGFGMRWLNPVTRQWEIDAATNQFKQMPRNRHRVMHLLFETFGSSTVRPNDGLEMPEKMGDGFERLQEAAVRRCLYPLTDIDRVIQVKRVVTERINSQRAHTDVEYFDYELEETDTVRFG